MSILGHRIVCAAIRASDGRVVCGVRHYDDIMRRQIHETEDGFLKFRGGGVDQGFVDNHFRFLTRQEAWVVAEQAGQILRQTGSNPGTLFSEDLY